MCEVGGQSGAAFKNNVSKRNTKEQILFQFESTESSDRSLGKAETETETGTETDGDRGGWSPSVRRGSGMRGSRHAPSVASRPVALVFEPEPLAACSDAYHGPLLIGPLYGGQGF